jgi:hypothetical protein
MTLPVKIISMGNHVMKGGSESTFSSVLFEASTEAQTILLNLAR